MTDTEPLLFPARVDGQHAIVVITGDAFKWNPSPTELRHPFPTGHTVPLSAITDVRIHDLGDNLVLDFAADGRRTRVHAKTALIEKALVFLGTHGVM